MKLAFGIRFVFTANRLLIVNTKPIVGKKMLGTNIDQYDCANKAKKIDTLIGFYEPPQHEIKKKLSLRQK